MPVHASRQASRDAIGKPKPQNRDRRATPSKEKPGPDASKAEMLDWLKERGIKASQRETKAGLREKVEKG